MDALFTWEIIIYIIYIGNFIYIPRKKGAVYREDAKFVDGPLQGSGSLPSTQPSPPVAPAVETVDQDLAGRGLDPASTPLQKTGNPRPISSCEATSCSLPSAKVKKIKKKCGEKVQQGVERHL